MQNLRFAAWYNLFLAAMAAVALLIGCDPLWSVAFVLLWLIVGAFLVRCVADVRRLLDGPFPRRPPLVHGLDPFREGHTLCGLPRQEVERYRWVGVPQTEGVTCPQCLRRIHTYGQ